MMKRVSITGPESTGKSTLSRLLAGHYDTVWVPEYARTYLDEHGPGYALPDLELMARGQLAAEEATTGRSRRVLFCDTDLLVIKIWAEHAFGRCPAWVLHQLREPRYDLTLLLGVDLPWEPDPLREHPEPAQRRHFYELYRRELTERSWPFVEISGPPEQRLQQAIKAVDALLASR
ncbi:ATP-binding protein [Hymenobacter sp. BT175]|uniref:AAA family ATPase n=1 Tax=Hymenobacter translucens TaxID=2886507 RepID=UPI001D0EF00E|nr:ATP-binding protein [Hymenobacter translucens]MCC2548430.1 ATP-binding protein [Hymenobacter translucens]